MINRIENNFLDNRVFHEFQKTVFFKNFNWNINNFTFEDSLDYLELHYDIVTIDKNKKRKTGDLTSIILTPILKKLKPVSVNYSYLKLFSKTKNIIDIANEQEPFNDEDSYTAILYLNTNNGFTKFYNDEDVPCVENKIVIFSNKTPSLETTTTNTSFKSILKINYTI